MSESSAKKMKMSTDDEFDFTTKTWMSDVTFLVEGKCIYGSRAILGLCSPVFSRMFSSGRFVEGRKREVTLSDKRYDDVLEFMKCLYPTVAKPVTKQNVFVILPLAHEYCVNSLLETCEKCILNFIPILQLSSSPLLQNLSSVYPYSLDKVNHALLEKLAEIDPEDVISTAEGKTEFHGIIQYVQRGVAKIHYDQLQKTRLQLVKSSLLSPVPLHLQSESLVGFEDAEGANINLVIPNVSEMFGGGGSAKSKYVLLSGVHMIATSSVLKVKEGTEDVPWLFIHLHAPFFKTVTDKKWMCKTRAKLIFKSDNSRSPFKIDQVHDKTFSFSNKEYSVVLFQNRMITFLDPRSRFISNNRMYAEIFLLANKPQSN